MGIPKNVRAAKALEEPSLPHFHGQGNGAGSGTGTSASPVGMVLSCEVVSEPCRPGGSCALRGWGRGQDTLHSAGPTASQASETRALAPTKDQETQTSTVQGPAP